MTPDEKHAHARSFPIHVGVDTAKTFHVLVAQGPAGQRSRPFQVEVSRAGFAATDAHLRGLFPDHAPAQMLVGLEFAGHHGFTFARFLAAQGYPVVNVLPAHTNRSKELEDNSPLKTDAKDAAQIARLVSQGIFVRFPFLTTPYVELRLLSVQRHRLTVEATRFKNRLQGVLDLAWPEFLSHFSSLHKRTPLAILERWPLPAEFAAAAPQTVGRHIKAASRGHISRERVSALRQSARDTIALTQATPERRMEITQLLARWALVREQLVQVEARIVGLVAQCPEARVLLSVPEISSACAATIVAELGTPADFQHPRQVLKLAGMNLVGRQSGQTAGRRRQSKRGRPMLRRQFFLLAGRWCQPRGLYRPEYEAMRARGVPGTKAVCTIARKLVPMLLQVMQTGQPFDEARWRGNRRQAAA